MLNTMPSAAGRPAVTGAQTEPLHLALPFRIAECQGRLSAAAVSALLLPIAGVFLAATASIAISAVLDPAVRELAQAHPTGSAVGVVGLLLAVVLFGWPVVQRIPRLVGRRDIEITDTGVTVRHRTWLGEERWSAPLGAFEGVAHHVRTLVSGARHELVLVHPERHRSLVVLAGDHFTPADVQAVCAALGLDEVPARRLYGRGRYQAATIVPEGARPAVA